jgi:hypothetical protein
MIRAGSPVLEKIFFVWPSKDLGVSRTRETRILFRVLPKIQKKSASTRKKTLAPN